MNADAPALRRVLERLRSIAPSLSLVGLVAEYRASVERETGRPIDHERALRELDHLHAETWDRAATEMETRPC